MTNSTRADSVANAGSRYAIKTFFDKDTFTLTYVVSDPKSRDCVVIDSVLDYDPAASSVSEHSIIELTNWLRSERLTVRMILETHAHADHVSGSQELVQRFPDAKVAIGERITSVQKVFAKVFEMPADFHTDGRQFDRLLKDGEVVSAGTVSFKVLFTPGHTPACASYLFDDAVFTGDALFMPDYGTGRCDFPEGDAATLYDSITTRLYTLPDSTRVFTGHDYMPQGRGLRFESTIGEEKKTNIQLRAETTREQYIKFRTDRDKTLSAPRLLLPSVQINIDAGHLPPLTAKGNRMLRIPLDVSRLAPKK